MKRILTSAFVILLTIGAAQAQTTGTEKNKHHKKEQKMRHDDLDLTADQKTRLKAINKDFKAQSDELNKQDNITVAEMKLRKEALHKSHQAQVETILTTEQKDQLAKKKTEWKGKESIKKEKERTTGSERRGDKLEKELNLTLDQQAKMTKIRTEYKSKFDAVRTDASLSRDVKKDRMKELMQAQQEQLKTVLTKDQIEKIQLLKQERSAKNTK